MMVKHKISPFGLEGIKKFEGCRLVAYEDAVGVWTIGYGHTKGVRPTQKITQAEADRLLTEDLAEFARGLERLVSMPLSQPQTDALLSFVYNVGLRAFERSTLRRRINEGAPSMVIQAEFLRWNKAGGHILAGLTKRRKWEANLWVL